MEKRLRQKEETLDRNVDQNEKRDQELNKRDRDYTAKERSVQEKEEKYLQILGEQTAMLEKISGISSEEARQEILRRTEEEARLEIGKLIKKIEDEAKETVEKKAKEVIGFAVQRYASDYVADATVSAVSLPSDEMKGRIIGREGRNIRALEAATGVDLIVDDTPEMVTLSGFDPVRREIAKLSLERLISSDPLAPEGAPNPYVDHKASAERALFNVAHLEPMTQRTFVEALARIAGIEPTPLETALRAGFAWYLAQPRRTRDYSFEDGLIAQG